VCEKNSYESTMDSSESNLFIVHTENQVQAIKYPGQWSTKTKNLEPIKLLCSLKKSFLKIITLIRSS
jgi:hypothetical protein